MVVPKAKWLMLFFGFHKHMHTCAHIATHMSTCTYVLSYIPHTHPKGKEKSFDPYHNMYEPSIHYVKKKKLTEKTTYFMVPCL